MLASGNLHRSVERRMTYGFAVHADLGTCWRDRYCHRAQEHTLRVELGLNGGLPGSRNRGTSAVSGYG